MRKSEHQQKVGNLSRGTHRKIVSNGLRERGAGDGHEEGRGGCKWSGPLGY